MAVIFRLVSVELGRRFHEWSAAVFHEMRLTAMAARNDELRQAMTKLEARPLKGEGQLGSERLARVAAEESVRALELENTRLKRQVAAAPALKQRERDRTRWISDDWSERIQAAEAETTKLAHASKLSAISRWLQLAWHAHPVPPAAPTDRW